MSLLTKHFNNLRSIGGEADGRVIFKLAGTQPGQDMIRYESIEAKITLIIPFTFNGHDLISVVEAGEIETTMKTVRNISELYALLCQLRRAALGKALQKAMIDIPKQMKDIRGTVSNRKTKKKVRATLNKFGVWGLAVLYDRDNPIKETK